MAEAMRNHRFVCVACGAEVVIKNSLYAAANVAVGALGWGYARHPKQPCDFCLQCPKCTGSVREEAA